MIGAPVCMVFFLITLYDELSNQEVWKSFLEHAPSEHYRILLHAKAPHKLNLTLMEEFSANIQVIPSVDSAYAKLVKPMAALFRAALNESSHPLDSFHMISSDTIPVKSFNELRGRHCSLPSSQTPDTPLLSRSVVPSQICGTVGLLYSSIGGIGEGCFISLPLLRCALLYTVYTMYTLCTLYTLHTLYTLSLSPSLSFVILFSKWLQQTNGRVYRLGTRT